ncbi:MAG: DUF364 domain-containing protein [Eubacteriales bacterium]|nr:DUF364 domain-containing protein [Eubacteriales bacterium]
MNPWRIYDELIDGVDTELKVTSVLTGHHWCTVRCGERIGMAMTVSGGGPRIHESMDYTGMSLRDAASLIKSWHYPEASIGMAALNCFYNTPDRIRAMGGFEGMDLNALTPEKRIEKEAFFSNRAALRGMKVCVIGHFPDLERQLKARCELTILERAPSGDDLPDPACEYILPSQDAVFITGITLTNKTLPRLLALCSSKAKVFLVGPSVCFAPLWFRWNVDHLSGFAVLDGERLEEIVRANGQREIFQAGVMVDVIRRKDE